MSNRKINIIFIAEVGRSKPMLEPNDILNQVLLKEDIGIYRHVQVLISVPSHDEVGEAIRRFKNNKSAGCEGLPISVDSVHST